MKSYPLRTVCSLTLPFSASESAKHPIAPATLVSLCFANSTWRINMKRKIAYVALLTGLAVAPLAFTTGCAVAQHRETAGSYAKDKEIEARIKASMYRDPLVKGTQVEVKSLNG